MKAVSIGTKQDSEKVSVVDHYLRTWCIYGKLGPGYFSRQVLQV